MAWREESYRAFCSHVLQACEIASKNLAANAHQMEAMRQRLLTGISAGLSGVTRSASQLQPVALRVNGPQDPDKRLPNTLRSVTWWNAAESHRGLI